MTLVPPGPAFLTLEPRALASELNSGVPRTISGGITLTTLTTTTILVTTTFIITVTTMALSLMSSQ